MMNSLSFIFLIYYTQTPVLGSDNVLDLNLKELSFPEGFYKNDNLGNIGDVLLNKKFDNGHDVDRGIFGRNDHKFAFDEGNPDIHGVIERPCQAYDSFCIRKFFAEHSKCKISGRRLPEPFFRAQSNYHYPSANISGTNLNFILEGLNNARVEEFYINKVTDNLVITFYFDAVTIKSNNTNIKYYLRGREPEVNRDSASLIFLQLSITMIIPGLDDLRLDRAEIYTYGENPILPFAFGPRIGMSSDPEVAAMFTFFATAGFSVENLEQMSTEGVFYAINYLQYNICDFGLKSL